MSSQKMLVLAFGGLFIAPLVPLLPRCKRISARLCSLRFLTTGLLTVSAGAAMVLPFYARKREKDEKRRVAKERKRTQGRDRSASMWKNLNDRAKRNGGGG